jgi:carboxyl-terminal processing protease
MLKYIHKVKKTKKEKERQAHNAPEALKRAVTLLTVAAIMLTTLIAFTSCNIIYTGDPIVNNNKGDSQLDQAPTVEIKDELDLPEYIQDLIKLDEVFQYYSHDGIDEQAMKIAILKAYIEATGDVYAEYMTAEEYDAYFSDRSGNFVGIGVSVVDSKIEINGFTYGVLEIVSVFKDSPAFEGGVMVGDCVVYVGRGENRELVDKLGYNGSLDKMLGEEGTKAEFTVFRPKSNGDYEEIEFSITRRKVVSESVTYRISSTNSKVGIVHISGFDDTTPKQFCAAVDALKAQKCEYFVFDVRNNPGGGLDSIETVLSYFLEKGDLIVSTEYSEALKSYNYSDYVREKKYSSQYSGLNVTAMDIGKYKNLKCIVLTNENTASAGELFTATFRDYGLAKIVGTTTYGKGCMQTLFPLDEYGLEGGLKLTVAMYFSASHTDYHGIGIKPDIEVELSEEARKYNFFLLPEELDNQLLTAIEELTK